MSAVFFVGAIIVILALCIVGGFVAAAIVAQNWRIIVYVAVAMVMMAGLAAACHTLRG